MFLKALEHGMEELGIVVHGKGVTRPRHRLLLFGFRLVGCEELLHQSGEVERKGPGWDGSPLLY